MALVLTCTTVGLSNLVSRAIGVDEASNLRAPPAQVSPSRSFSQASKVARSYGSMNGNGEHFIVRATMRLRSSKNMIPAPARRDWSSWGMTISSPRRAWTARNTVAPCSGLSKVLLAGKAGIPNVPGKE